MTMFRSPHGNFNSKEEYLKAFKEQNNIEWIEEDVFMDCLQIRNEGREHPSFRWNLLIDQPKMRKRSIVRDALRWFLTWFIKITT